MRALLIACALLLCSAPVCAAQTIASRPVEARALPRGVTYRGNVVAAREWTDRGARNVLVLTVTPEFPSRGECDPGEGCRDRELYAYHYVQRAGGYALLWSSTDYVRGCPLDLSLEFAPGSAAVTDLDADGVAETSFVYVSGCMGGVDPLTMKLIMHEGATKYALRGNTDLEAELGPEGRGRMTVDAAFAAGPPALRAFAMRQWTRFERVANWPRR